MLNAVSDRFRLQNLRRIYQALKACGISVKSRKLTKYQLIAAKASLMLFHNAAVDISITWQSVALYGFHRGKGLETELADVSVKLISAKNIVGLPIVTVAASLAIRISKTAL
jgi:hypothetical protein